MREGDTGGSVWDSGVRSADVATVRGANVRGGVVGIISDGFNAINWGRSKLGPESGSRLGFSSVLGGVTGPGPREGISKSLGRMAGGEPRSAARVKSLRDLSVARGLMCCVGDRGRPSMDAG